MKLHWSPRSPYVRKVMIVAHELGLEQRIQRVRSVVTMREPNLEVMRDNPLAKIPTLVLENGESLFDSAVICEYLDFLAGGNKVMPPPGSERWPVLTRHALANGLIDILILWRNERDKPKSSQTDEWLSAFEIKTVAALASMERQLLLFDHDNFYLDQITFGCCLSYMDFRFDSFNWRHGRPRLADWYGHFEQRSSAIATAISAS